MQKPGFSLQKTPDFSPVLPGDKSRCPGSPPVKVSKQPRQEGPGIKHTFCHVYVNTLALPRLGRDEALGTSGPGSFAEVEPIENHQTPASISILVAKQEWLLMVFVGEILYLFMGLRATGSWQSHQQKHRTKTQVGS